MTRVSKVRAASWVVMFTSLAVFLYFGRSLPPGVNTARDVALLFLPHQVGSVAMLALIWVGPFPESWPLIGGKKRFNKLFFWLVATTLGAFWVFFYAVFVFRCT